MATPFNSGYDPARTTRDSILVDTGRAALKVVTLTVTAPCGCYIRRGFRSRPVRWRIRALVLVPRERYDRKCSACGQHWTGLRKTLREDEGNGVRIDEIVWETM